MENTDCRGPIGTEAKSAPCSRPQEAPAVIRAGSGTAGQARPARPSVEKGGLDAGSGALVGYSDAMVALRAGAASTPGCCQAYSGTRYQAFLLLFLRFTGALHSISCAPLTTRRGHGGMAPTDTPRARRMVLPPLHQTDPPRARRLHFPLHQTDPPRALTFFPPPT